MKYKLSHFKYELPQKFIAERPTKNRDGSKLMIVDRNTGEIKHKKFGAMLDYFEEADTIVMNNTKVFPARMYGNKEKTGARKSKNYRSKKRTRKENARETCSYRKPMCRSKKTHENKNHCPEPPKTILNNFKKYNN